MRAIIPLTMGVRALRKLALAGCVIAVFMAGPAGCAGQEQNRCTAPRHLRKLHPPPRPRPSSPPVVRSEHVELALLDAEGDGAWVFLAPESDLRPRLAVCYRSALEKEPSLTGHMVFTVQRAGAAAAAKVDLLQRSELPSVLVDCVAQVLESLQTSPELAMEPNLPASHVYVSLY